MKVKAEKYAPNMMRLWCEPRFGKPYYAFAHWDGRRWRLSSDRDPSRAMLNAIDRVPFWTEYES